MSHNLPSFLRHREENLVVSHKRQADKLPFIDNTLKTIASFIKSGYLQSETARNKGFLQRIDARIKLLFLLAFIIIINVNSHLAGQIFIAFYLVGMYVFSNIRVVEIFKKITMLGFMFGFLVIAPAALNVVTSGAHILTLIQFDKPHQFWIYHIPASIYLTKEGCIIVGRFYLKVSNAIALSLLILYTTPFNEIIRSLKVIHVPDVFLLIITLSYKFIFILAQTTEETYMALKARWWRNTGAGESKKLVAGRIVFIFRKSWVKYEEIYKAMIARGFTGEVCVIDVVKHTRMDIIFVISFVIWGVLSCII